MPIASLDDYKKKEDDEKKGTQSYSGGEKSGLNIQNPADPDHEEQWRRITSAAGSSSGPAPADHTTVTVYRNGFVVGDGPFRPLTDPANRQFIDELSRGEQPSELQRGGADVHVALNDKRSEDFKEPPAPAYTKFSGEGNSLSARSSSTAASAPVQAGEGTIVVDASKPKSRIQIRFHDGQKKAQEFNEDHTVGDLRSFCQQCVGGTAMQVMGGFPPKPLTDDSQTLKAAGLLGAAVTVRPA